MSSDSDLRCSSCSRIPTTKLKACTACRSAHYCDISCQKKHWAQHKGQCNRLKAEFNREVSKVVASAVTTNPKLSSDLKISKEDVKIVINSDKTVCARTRDLSDGYVYSQFMPQKAYADYINATKFPCWCNRVGLEQSLLVVFTFDPSTLASSNGVLKSKYLSTPFGVTFQIGIAEIMGNLSIDISEEPVPGVPLDSVKGKNCRATYFFLKGNDATQITLPPPSKGKFKRAGEQIANSHMHIWPGVGLKAALGLHELKAIPRVTGKSLKGSAFDDKGLEFPTSCVAIAMLIECVGEIETADEFEVATIKSNLHTYHSDERKDEEVPEFCKNACRNGLKKLNNEQPVDILGLMPQETKTATPAATKTKSAIPKGLEGLSPAALVEVMEVMKGLQAGKPDMTLIEKTLGSEEAGPALQKILSSPEVAPLMKILVEKMAQK